MIANLTNRTIAPGRTLIVTALLVLFSVWTVAHASDNTEPQRGQIVGGQMSEHPDWFKESFLDIAEDVAEAADDDKHVMLFMHLNGCPYCYKMVEENIKHAPYTDFIKEHFDVISLNIRGDREVAFNADLTVTEKTLAEHLKVMYTPTVIFLDRDNRPVARINGYRSVPEFKWVLDYVQQRAYENQTLAAYIDEQKTPRYAFRDHPMITEATDLQALAAKPLAVLFEDKSCVDCDKLHDGYLQDPEVLKILEKYTLVRLDALSDDPITAVDGTRTTPREYAADLDLTYRPGFVLFDEGREIARIESELYRFHFTELLRYVGDGLYWDYPDSFYDYLGVRTDELLSQGEDVDLGE
jgi:thioredoxin-related protein